MVSLLESYDYAEALTKAERTTFYHTFRFLTPERRRSIFAIYAFSRRADDAVDSVEEASVPEEEARALLAELESFLGDAPSEDDPLVPALRDTLEKFQIPRRHLDELLKGMEMDLHTRRYATFDDLYQYCYRAASAVGLVCIEIFGHEGKRLGDDSEESDLQSGDVQSGDVQSGDVQSGDVQSGDVQSGDVQDIEEPAEALGIAMQLTNIIRDVAEDAQRNRIYLPLEDLKRFGCDEDHVLRGVVDKSFREMMKFQVERARHYFELSDPLYPAVYEESRYCPELLRKFYSQILDRVERQDYDVFSQRPSLPPYRKLMLVAQMWWKARRAGKASTNGSASS